MKHTKECDAARAARAAWKEAQAAWFKAAHEKAIKRRR